LIAAYKEHSFLLGREVSFEQNGQFITGTAADINDEGNLIVEAGRTYVLSSGEVSLRSWESPDE
jgi:BirA family biotin operon repressor/biotin-[acetyl-CoA-carboxylase] ligase